MKYKIGDNLFFVEDGVINKFGPVGSILISGEDVQYSEEDNFNGSRYSNKEEDLLLRHWKKQKRLLTNIS